MRDAGLGNVEVYIVQRQNKFPQYTAIRKILDLCMEIDQSPGDRFSKRWWEQVVINLVGAQEEAPGAEGVGMGDIGEPHD